jgi:spermidine synthase
MMSSDFEWAAESTRCEGIPQSPEEKVKKGKFLIRKRKDEDEEESKSQRDGHVVPRPEIRRELVLETLSRLSQQGGAEASITTGLTYDEANHLLEEIDPSLISEFEQDFLLDNRRVVLEDNRYLRVVDCYGDVVSEEVNNRDELVEAKRIVISKDAPWLSQSEMYVYEDGSHCFGLLPQLIQQGLAVGGLLLEMSEEEEEGTSLALLGSGACVFSTVLSQHFPKIRIDVVDLDQRMLEMAEKHFGADFGPQSRVTKHAMDAQAFMKESFKKSIQFSFILVDICCVESGSIPPPYFTSPSFLSHLVEHALPAEGGVIGIHLAHLDTEEIFSRIESMCESLKTNGNNNNSTASCRVYSLVLNEESGGLRSAAVLIHKITQQQKENTAPVTTDELQGRAKAHPILASLAQDVFHLLSKKPLSWRVHM